MSIALGYDRQRHIRCYASKHSERSHSDWWLQTLIGGCRPCRAFCIRLSGIIDGEEHACRSRSMHSSTDEYCRPRSERCIAERDDVVARALDERRP
eukprot:3939353-Rhodomonas_salina.3